MIWRLTGLALCLLGYGAAWLAEVAGAHVLLAPLVVIPVLMILIAGGNWLQQWLGIQRPSPKFSQPTAREDVERPDRERP